MRSISEAEVQTDVADFGLKPYDQNAPLRHREQRRMLH